MYNSRGTVFPKLQEKRWRDFKIEDSIMELENFTKWEISRKNKSEAWSKKLAYWRAEESNFELERWRHASKQTSIAGESDSPLGLGEGERFGEEIEKKCWAPSSPVLKFADSTMKGRNGGEKYPRQLCKSFWPKKNNNYVSHYGPMAKKNKKTMLVIVQNIFGQKKNSTKVPSSTIWSDGKKKTI